MSRKALAARKRRDLRRAHERVVEGLRLERAALEAKLAAASDDLARVRALEADPVAAAEVALKSLAKARGELAGDVTLLVVRAQRLGLALEGFLGSVAQAWRTRTGR